MPSHSSSKALVDGAAERIRGHIEASIAAKQKLLESGSAALLQAAGVLVRCISSGGKIMLCGNGGSAADAQHIAAEFVSTLNHDQPRPGMAAIALTTDTSFLTAHANDFGFDEVFERQVQALGKPGDVVIGLSTSGNSQNVVRALEYAKGQGISAIAMTGEGGGKLAGIADLTLRAASGATAHIQESHIMMGHILCDLVEQSVGR